MFFFFYVCVHNATSVGGRTAPQTVVDSQLQLLDERKKEKKTEKKREEDYGFEGDLDASAPP